MADLEKFQQEVTEWLERVATDSILVTPLTALELGVLVMTLQVFIRETHKDDEEIENPSVFFRVVDKLMTTMEQGGFRKPEPQTKPEGG